MFFRKSLYIIFLFLFFLSCSNRPEDVLSAREMTTVLVELHTLDGIFETNEYRHLDASEKNKYYEAILERHHIHREQFDSSLVWYSRDPKKFEKIYVRVVDRLTAEEENVKAGKYHSLVSQQLMLTTTELWKDSTHFTLKNDSSARNRLAFVITDSALMMQDIYTLRFRSRIEAEDSCANHYIRFNVHNASGRVDSLYYPTQHDGKLRRYTLRLQADGKEKIDSLSGYFLASDTCSFVQNAYVDSISLTRKCNADIQEELRTKTERYENYRTFKYRLFPMREEKKGLIFSGKSY